MTKSSHGRPIAFAVGPTRPATAEFGEAAGSTPSDLPPGPDHAPIARLLPARAGTLLAQAFEDPHTLTSGEVRELAASVVLLLASMGGDARM